MALGIVQAGYRSSLYVYTAENNPDWESSFEEWLAELTTGLELAMEDSMGDTVPDSEDGADGAQEDGQTEAYSARKKEWEEQLEQATVVEAMLRQALENGLGQQKEEDQKPQKKKEEEPDNDFSLEGLPMMMEGKGRSCQASPEHAGSSQFLQNDSGYGAEYFNLGNGGREVPAKQQLRVLCLTCETECDRKKQWKITG